MTTLPIRVDTDSISARARDVHFVPWLLNLIATVLIATGFLAYKATRGLFLAGVWTAMSLADGWHQAKAAEARKKAQAQARARNA